MADKNGALVRPVYTGPVTAMKEFIELTSNWFSPQQPIAPQAPPGTPARQRDYPVGYNINIVPRGNEEITFAQLRDLASLWDLLALVIETRKDQVASVPWTIRPKELPGESKLEYKDRIDTVPGIETVTRWLARPDGQLLWHPWIRKLVHEHLVLDAVCVLPRKAVGHTLLDIIDGSTIAIKIDSEGRRPPPPSVAYQQVLKGLPAIDFTTDELRYYMRSPRADRIYGYSPVEQIIYITNLAVRRAMYKIGYYTEGNLPEAIIQLPENWPIDKIRQFSEWWNSVLAGQVDQRRKAFFIPTIGGEKAISYPKQDAIKDEMDEWLARVVCYAFSVSPQAFVREMNRATAQTAVEQAKTEGLQPLLNFLKEIFDDLIAVCYDRPDLEFYWQEDIEPDLLKRAQIQALKVEKALSTPNEMREENGDDPVEGGDELGVVTGTGFVPLSAAKDLADAAIEAKKNPPAPMVAGNANGNGKKPDVAKRGRVANRIASDRAKRTLAHTTKLTARFLARQGREAAQQLSAALTQHALPSGKPQKK